MLIRVRNIPATGETHEVDLETPWALEAITMALDGVPEVGRARFEVQGPIAQRVAVRVIASASRMAICDRCGEPTPLRINTDLVLAYIPRSGEVTSPSEEEEIELQEDELDVGWYESGSIALPDVLTEALALETPSRITCEDEEGCDVRTAELLASATAGSPGHPAFEALKNLKN